MNKVNGNKTPHLNVLKQYIKDLSYENFQKNNAQNTSLRDSDTSIDIKVINEPYDKDHFGVIIKITINCESKKDKTILFHLELDYFGFFKIENVKNFDINKLSSEGARLLFPFARFVIANITQNGGNIPIILDNIDFNLMKS